MKRPKQHVMEEQSARLVDNLLPTEWIVRRIGKDYGVDLEVELVDQEEVTGNRVWIQLKATRKLIPRIANVDSNTGPVKLEYVSFRLSTKELSYALQCPFPLLLFVADLDEGDIFWLPLRDSADASLFLRVGDWRQQKTITLKIPTRNSLSKEAETNFSGLRWYALEPARMCAFALLHRYHHDAQHYANLSGFEFDDGLIETSAGVELRQNLTRTIVFLKAALEIDVLFGMRGFDLCRTRGYAECAVAMREGISCAERALVLLASGEFTFDGLAILLAKVHHAVNMLSLAIRLYEQLRQQYVVEEGSSL